MNFINTDRFFSEVLPHISPLTAGEELIENAQRAGASEITFTYNGGNKVEIENNGEAVNDLLNMFVVADTHYSDQTVSSQNPAGMGMLIILSGVERIKLSSKENEFEIISDNFFKDSSYRDVLKMTKGNTLVLGLKMELEFKTEKEATSFVENIKILTHKYKVEITVVEPTATTKVLPFEAENILGQISFGENCDPRWKNCIIQLNKLEFSELHRNYLFWFGKKVFLPFSDLFSFDIEVVGENTFLSPNLPDRSKVNQSEEEMHKFFNDLIFEFKEEVLLHLEHKRANTIKNRYGERRLKSLYEICIDRKIIPASAINDFTSWGGCRKRKTRKSIDF